MDRKTFIRFIGLTGSQAVVENLFDRSKNYFFHSRLSPRDCKVIDPDRRDTDEKSKQHCWSDHAKGRDTGTFQCDDFIVRRDSSEYGADREEQRGGQGELHRDQTDKRQDLDQRNPAEPFDNQLLSDKSDGNQQRHGRCGHEEEL